MFKSILSQNVEGKKVLVRVDFNVELSEIKEYEEHFRFTVVRDTVSHLVSQPGTKVALLTHFGRPKAGERDPEFSTARLLGSVERSLNVKVTFVPTCRGTDVIAALSNQKEGEILLLENVRFEVGEEEGDLELAKDLARPFDVFVNEAFSVCHRDHASVTKIPHFLPSFAGARLVKEVSELEAVRMNPVHPAIAIIGGAKIETKLPLIRALEPIYDCVLVGGKIANEAIDQKTSFSEKVLLPVDFNSTQRLDIGPQTIAYYSQIIKKAKTVVWNGPMGKFEEKPYDMGTDAILHAVLESEAKVVIGGGESLAVLENAGVMGKIGFVSSGGGAMLDYLSGTDLPGIKALENSAL